jgi:CheY-like chemotaxis protein
MISSSDPTPTERWPLAAVLVVDDEPGMRNFLEKTLVPRVAHVLAAETAEDADTLVRRHRFDLVILDIALPGKSGIQWLRELREQGYAGEVVLITAFADLDTAIEALRAGASDFILKPFRVTQLLNAVKQGLERGLLKRENWVLKRALKQRTPPPGALVGRSAAIRSLQTSIELVAAVDSTVLLTGESGTGKELAALALHRGSVRAGGPFVPVNCATMSPEAIESELFGHAASGASGARDGLFVYAQGGTLFLDEVGELPMAMQAWKTGVCGRSAASSRSRSTCASSPPATARSPPRWRPGVSARTCTTGCRWSRSRCPRCARTRTTSLSWSTTSSPPSRRSSGCRRSRSASTNWTTCASTTGRAMCVSFAT